MDRFRTAWANLQTELAALRKVRRQQRALDLILKSQRIDPEVLGAVIAEVMEIAAERVASTPPDPDNCITVDMRDVVTGPWGVRL